ncbi:hypothetical protein Emtol_3657 [Emticicia oligotrophica DSM 17448]|uniref:DUF5723 domain-containing protein n=1 Tax=Emticicia oligotrophica (strain DSM 17448 / CIP 109782 / MTCC 6937 / GPTSA100-15) TaxID=929562 RepID=A0ABM5N5J1_EMTOG|nr:DUF5723 family protein [Emticicia oligotrophica]AFK04783.1 hypothetical protein Emtol_3657 [Emticicia oligotrophica DSM 17448]
MRILFCLFFLTISTSYAQQWLGISSSNYSGTYGIYNNPANIADSRYKFFMNFAGANADVINNYASWAAPFSIVGLMTRTVPNRYLAPSGLPIFSLSYIKEKTNISNVTSFASIDIKGPSLMYNFSKYKFSIGLTSRVRVLTNLNNTTPDVAHILVKTTFDPNIFGVRQDNSHFSMNTNGFAEMGLTIGAVIKEQEQDFFKIGLTAKRLNGLFNVHLLADNLDYVIDANALRPLRQDLFFYKAQGIYGTTSGDALRNFSFTPNWLFGNLAAGTGYGIDIGGVYEYRPDFYKYDIKLKGKWSMDGTKNKYLYRLGFALLDVGSIHYNNPAYVKQVGINKPNVYVAPETFSKIDSPDKFYHQMNDAFNIAPASYTSDFTVVLPMALSTNFDYKYSEKIYINASWIQSLRNPKVLGMNQPSLIALTPRFETKWIDVAAPIALQNGYRNLTIGLMGRFGPLFIGTENLGGVLNIAKPNGINFYMGLFLPLFMKLPDSPNGCYVETTSGLKHELRELFKKNKQKRKWNKVR